MDVVLRHELRPGDLGTIVRLHGEVYAQEYGFDVTFEAYVAGPLAEFATARGPRDRLFLAEQGGEVVGSVAIVDAGQEAAQLRWFLVVPRARGQGLGSRLLREAVEFARGGGYGAVFLWTVSALVDAARLYRAFGFECVEERLGQRFGTRVVEERYVLRL